MAASMNMYASVTRLIQLYDIELFREGCLTERKWSGTLYQTRKFSRTLNYWF